MILVTYIKRKSKKQEERTAREFYGKTQIASGAIESIKGDVRTGEREAGKFNNDDFLIENKFTDSDRYKFTLPTWNKISHEAFRDNFRTPLMQVDIKDLQLVIIDDDTAKIMGFELTKYHGSTGKTYTMDYSTMSKLFSEDIGEVLAVYFEKTQDKVFIMSKNDFLRKLG